MIIAEGLQPIPSGKLRAIEENVQNRTEVFLGDFYSFDSAHKKIETRFKNQGLGWFTYSIYNADGVRIFIATTTKRKIKVFGFIPITKTTFVSEISSFR